MTEEEKMAILQEQINHRVEVMNTMPRPEMDNLSPSDMYQILYYTFGEDSPVGIKSDIKPEVFDNVPFIQLVRAYMNILHEAGELKLTPKGNLPRKTCVELYNMGFIKEYILEVEWGYKLTTQDKSKSLTNLKIICDMAGITKKRNGKASLTTKGKKLLDREKSAELFKVIFGINIDKFNLGYHDGYPYEAQIQQVFGYTLYLLLRYGDELRKFDFYAEKKLEAFPQLIEHFFANASAYRTPESIFASCYWIRIFKRFLEFYGFIETNDENEFLDKDKIKVKTTPVFHQVFELKPDNFQFRISRHEA